MHNLYLLGCVIWDLGFGPQWQYRNFTLKILYESHLFFNQNQFAHFTNNQSGLFLSTQGDLFLKGYTLDLNYVF